MFVFILMTRRPPRSPLFPDTTLFRSPDGPHGCSWRAAALGSPPGTARTVSPWGGPSAPRGGDGVIGSPPAFGAVQSRFEDRKSTRLNSSHANISYAVFCLKKKTKLST